MADKIEQLLRTQGTTRDYRMDDDTQGERSGGSVSWRNNNPGNLKFEHADSADRTVRSTRTRDDALAAAQRQYRGVVGLDQWGNAVCETYEAGREAKVALLQRRWGERTIPEVLTSYSTADYSGRTNHDAQAAAIYAEGDRQDVELRGKRVEDMSARELDAMADGIRRFEGWTEGITRELTPTPAREINAVPPAGPGDPTSSRVPIDMRDPAHADHGMFRQAYADVARIDGQHGRDPGMQTERLAAALVAQGKSAGLETIRHVGLSVDGARAFAVDTDLSSPLARRAHVEVSDAILQRVEASNERLQAANQKAAEQQIAMQPLIHAHDDVARTGPRMS